ncbi:thiosulfate oxidation carrier protein SoxY [Bosea sp. BH3]|uniref:thiosulfate oxidation carrier protein SoxY n=1 Tax=Bosea sp. BH3 TaxID=2871701 RepID=UPI0021CB0649|nr:thiosulfate oxidation carrier protein SoxY [Bosea sp. BH3]MCU4178489.1 sulfur oxidation protein SoxY [Bosea sp. BH3]
MSFPISPRSKRSEAPSRRDVVALAAAGLVLPTLAGPARAETLDDLVRRVTDGVAPAAGGLTLEIPALVENGNSVDVRIAVDSPMTEAAHVRWIHLIAEKNPFPDMARIHLSPRSGRALVATTLRLAQSQTVAAVVAHSDGRYAVATAPVVVTLSACIDGG